MKKVNSNTEITIKGLKRIGFKGEDFDEESLVYVYKINNNVEINWFENGEALLCMGSENEHVYFRTIEEIKSFIKYFKKL